MWAQNSNGLAVPLNLSYRCEDWIDCKRYDSFHLSNHSYSIGKANNDFVLYFFFFQYFLFSKFKWEMRRREMEFIIWINLLYRLCAVIYFFQQILWLGRHLSKHSFFVQQMYFFQLLSLERNVCLWNDYCHPRYRDNILWMNAWIALTHRL